MSTSPDDVMRDAERLALWTAGEVREQAAQCAGQLDVWDSIDQTACDACGAAAGVPCDPFCLGLAAERDR